jgi:hypothetical protein
MVQFLKENSLTTTPKANARLLTLTAPFMKEMLRKESWTALESSEKLMARAIKVTSKTVSSKA